MLRKYKKLAIWLIMILGFSLRIYSLGRYGFWYDETLALSMAKMAPGLADFIKYSGGDAQSIFYAALSLWRNLGVNEFILRLLPLIFGMLSIGMIHKIGTTLSNEKTGLISSFILAVSPFHIYYSQELRVFTMICFFASVSVYYTIKLFREFNLSNSLLFIFSATLCLYLYDFSLILIVAENLFFVAFNRRKEIIRKWLFIQFVIALLYMPWFNAVVARRIFNYNSAAIISWIPEVNCQTIIQTFKIFNLGYNSTYYIDLVSFPFFTFLFLLGIWGILKDRKSLSILLFWLFIPIIIAVSVRLMPFFLPRTLIFILPAYYLIVAYGISKISNKFVTFFIILIVAVLSVLPLKNYYNNIYPFPQYPYRMGVHPKIENKNALKYIEQHFKKDDVIAHISRCTFQPFFYYQQKRMKNKLILFGPEELMREYKYVFMQPFDELMEYFGMVPVSIDKLTMNHKRVWLVAADWESGWNWARQTRKEEIIKAWLDNNYSLIDEKSFFGIKVYLYNIVRLNK